MGSGGFCGAAACVVADWYRLQDARSTRRKTAAALHTQHLMLGSRRLDVIRSRLVDVDLKQIISEITARVWEMVSGGWRADGTVGTSLSAGTVRQEGWCLSLRYFRAFYCVGRFDGTKPIWLGEGSNEFPSKIDCPAVAVIVDNLSR